MALLFMDSFDHYAFGDVTDKWLSGSVTLQTGRHGSSAVATNLGILAVISPASATIIAGVAVYSNTLNGTVALTIRDGLVGWDQASVRLNSDGSLSIGRGTAGVAFGSMTVYGTSAAGVVTLNTFYYIELKVTLHATTGSIDCRVNGVSVVSASNVNTAPSGTAQASLVGLGGTGLIMHFDDLYVCDSVGSANTDFLGDVRVDAHLPNGAGATSGWTPSAGSNYQCVDETTPNEDTDYVSTTAPGGVDTYNLEAFKNPGGAIKGIQVNVHAKATDVGTCSIAPVVRHSGTDYVGTTVALTTGYTYNTRQIYNTNPGTSAAWTETDFNNLEAGIKKIA